MELYLARRIECFVGDGKTLGWPFSREAVPMQIQTGERREWHTGGDGREGAD